MNIQDLLLLGMFVSSIVSLLFNIRLLSLMLVHVLCSLLVGRVPKGPV